MNQSQSITENNLAVDFYQVAAQFENNTALKYLSGEILTYRVLNYRSNQIARQMLDMGIKLGDCLVIFNDKSSNAFSLMFACIKIGVVYCNLDKNNPEQRLSKMLEVCQPVYIFDFYPHSHDELNDIRNKHSWPYLNCDKKFIKAFELQTGNNLIESNQIRGNSALYVVFTSGSTGTPKGALISHDNIRHLINWSQKRLGINQDDHLTNINPIHFDNSVFDIYATLFSGACLSPIESSYLSEPHLLVKAIEKLACNIWFSVPSLLVYLLTTKSWLRNQLPALRKIIFGGEGFPKQHLKHLFKLIGSNCQLINVYGPTECSCICSAYTIQKQDFDDMLELPPLGKIASHFNFKILDDDDSPASSGELVLSGKSVGMGYINAAKQTSEHFYCENDNLGIAHRHYKTGDIVQLKNQQLHFLGRKDNQIKHMGYRIELEEIENQVNAFKEVIESFAGYVKNDLYAGTIVLVVAMRKGHSIKQLKQSLISDIAEFMRPKKIICLEILPKNSNGKIDRQFIRQEYLNS